MVNRDADFQNVIKWNNQWASIGIIGLSVCNQYALGVFLNISSIFDSICPDHIKRCLLKHGGDPEIVGWYYGYLKHRDLYFELHGEKVACSTGREVCAQQNSG